MNQPTLMPDSTAGRVWRTGPSTASAYSGSGLDDLPLDVYVLPELLAQLNSAHSSRV